jgi:exodeoxyribonuclease VII small subunit
MKKQEEQPKSYEAAQAELEQIISDLQAEAISIDLLGQKIVRAKALIAFCREKLRQAERDLDQLAG